MYFKILHTSSKHGHSKFYGEMADTFSFILVIRT